MALDLSTIVHPDDAALRPIIFEKVLNSPGEPLKGYRKRMLHKNGTWRWLESTMTNLLHDPAINGIVDNFRDITDIKLAQEKLLHSELRLKQAQEISKTGSWEYELATEAITLSDEACRIYGLELTNNKLPIGEWLSFTHKDDLELLILTLEKIRDASINVNIEYQIDRRNGETRHVQLLARNGYDDLNQTNTIFGAIIDNTEQKISEETLKNSEHRFRVLVEGSGDAFAIISADGKVMYTSPSIQTLFGYSEDEALQLDLGYIIHPDDIEDGNKLFEKAFLNPGIPLTSKVWRMRHKNGSWRYIEAVITNMLHDPTINGIIDNFHDVTEAVLAQEQLKQQSERLKQAQEIAHFGSWELNLESGDLIWSDEQCRIFGLEPTENIQTIATWLSFIHPDDLDFVHSVLRDNQGNINNYSFDFRIIRNNKEIRYIHAIASSDLANDGKIIGFHGAIHDITEKKIIDEELKNSEHRLRALIENSASGISIINKEGKVTYVSSSIKSVLGFTDEEIMSIDFFSLVHPDHVLPGMQILEQAMANPGLPIQGHSVLMKHKDGSWRWVDTVLTNLLGDPTINGIVSNFRDVTDKQLDTEKIKNSEHRFRSMIENSTDVIIVFSPKMKIKYISPSIKLVLGYSEEEILDIDIFSLINRNDLIPGQKIIDMVLATPGVPIKGYTGQMRHKNGNWRWIETTITNMLRNPVINGIVVNAQDITDKKLASDKLLVANNLLAFKNKVNQSISKTREKKKQSSIRLANMLCY